MAQLVPKSFFPRNLFRFPISSFPSLWEELGGELIEEPSGLTVWEDNNEVNIEAKMPGLSSNDIEVTLNNGILSIQGERKEEEENKERKYHRKASYSYSYRVSLPTQTDENNPNAVYKDGVMKITFQKLAQGKGKTIPVKNN